MVTLAIRYTGDLRCEVVHTPSGGTLLTDAPVDNHGLGQNFSPTDLVAAALGSCILTVMGIAARPLGLSLEGAQVTVAKTMSPPPRRIAQLGVTITFPPGIPHAQRGALEAAALACPVHRSLHPDITVPVTFVWDAPAEN